MYRVTASSLPMTALLNRYTKPLWDKPGEPYTDSFAVKISHRADITRFVTAFYTTNLFKLERLVLKYLAAKSSTDADAELVAAGKTESFAAWKVEARTGNQLLMCDFLGRTRSWFMVDPAEAEFADSEKPGTLLRFGSAVVPVANAKTGDEELGRSFTFLLGFHRLYSRLLLSSAARRLERLSR